MKKGFTLVEVLVGTFLLLVVFLAFFSAYQVVLKLVEQNKNKITATAIASGELEKIRNLEYGNIGIKGGYPEGVLDATSTIIVNNLNYSVERRVDYVADSNDGLASPDDDCPNDYKKIEIKVSWSGLASGDVKLVSDASPQTLAEECAETGSILSVSVFDAYGIMIASPLIEVKDPLTGDNIKTATPDSGKYLFVLPAGTYRVVVSKSGYSSERTYGIDEVATPKKPNPSVLENQVTEISFSIDKLSSFSVDTLSPWGSDYFSDSFLDESKISEISDLAVANGEVNLATTTSGHKDSGHLVSTSTAPDNLLQWDEFSFDDSKPTNTQILYHILYFDGTNWELVPDSDLSGNSAGFGVSPVDLSGLDISAYSQLEIKGSFSTADTSTTPVLKNWQLSWKTNSATPIGNVTFHLEGEKIIGTDASETPVYKYSEDNTSDSGGYIDIPYMEWDNYNFSVSPSTGLDLIGTDPSPQPISLSPSTTLAVSLYLESQNSFLLTVKDVDTDDPILGTSVRIYNSSLSYDKTQNTNEKGQTYFIPLESGEYTIDVQIEGYQSYSGNISVSGDESKVISLTRIE